MYIYVCVYLYMDNMYAHIYTVNEVGTSECVIRRVAPPGGTEVTVMGVDRLLQSMTSVEAGNKRELPALLYLYNGLYSI